MRAAVRVSQQPNLEWIEKFDKMLTEQLDPASTGTELVNLSSGSRLRVMKDVVLLSSPDLLKTLRSIFVQRTIDHECWKDFEDQWVQTAFTKGKCGSLIDFSSLFYSSDPLSGKLLFRIFSSWSRCLQSFLENDLTCKLSSQDVATLEEALQKMIIIFVNLHKKAVKGVNSFRQMERLPKLWAEEQDAKKVAQKTKGIDARYDPNQSREILPHERLSQPMTILHEKIGVVFAEGGRK